MCRGAPRERRVQFGRLDTSLRQHGKVQNFAPRAVSAISATIGPRPQVDNLNAIKYMLIWARGRKGWSHVASVRRTTRGSSKTPISTIFQAHTNRRRGLEFAWNLSMYVLQSECSPEFRLSAFGDGTGQGSDHLPCLSRLPPTPYHYHSLTMLDSLPVIASVLAQTAKWAIITVALLNCRSWPFVWTGKVQSYSLLNKTQALYSARFSSDRETLR